MVPMLPSIKEEHLIFPMVPFLSHFCHARPNYLLLKMGSKIWIFLSLGNQSKTNYSIPCWRKRQQLRSWVQVTQKGSYVPIGLKMQLITLMITTDYPSMHRFHKLRKIQILLPIFNVKYLIHAWQKWYHWKDRVLFFNAR